MENARGKQAIVTGLRGRVNLEERPSIDPHRPGRKERVAHPLKPLKTKLVLEMYRV